LPPPAPVSQEARVAAKDSTQIPGNLNLPKILPRICRLQTQHLRRSFGAGQQNAERSSDSSVIDIRRRSDQAENPSQVSRPSSQQTGTSALVEVESVENNGSRSKPRKTQTHGPLPTRSARTLGSAPRHHPLPTSPRVTTLVLPFPPLISPILPYILELTPRRKENTNDENDSPSSSNRFDESGRPAN
jgi:hypothetical protein